MKPLLLDVMLGDRFYTQLSYSKRGSPDFINGALVEIHDYDDIKKFVLDRLPTLKGKDIHIEFASQKVLTN